MINVDTLAIVLRALGRAPSPRAPAPAAAVARVTPPSPVAVGVGSLPDAPDQHEQARRDGALAPAAEREGAQRSRTTVPSPYAGTSAGRGVAVIAGPTESGAVALSPAGALLLEAMNLPSDGRGPVVRTTAPLLSSPAHAPASLARAVEQAITRSGIFYESHVARWAENDFPESEIAREPQAGWTSSAPQMAAPDPKAAVHDAPMLIRQQLDAHEVHRLVLAAELWPGQQAVLTFEEPGRTREHTTAGVPKESERVWSARIDLALESLGNVTMVVALRDADIDCRVTVATRDAETRLEAARHDLAAAVRGQGLQLAQCAICHER